MKRATLLVVILILMGTDLVDAQAWRMRRYEAIAGLATSNYFGDIGGYSRGDNFLGLRDYKFLETRPSLFLGARYKVIQDLSVRFNLTFGFLHGSDKGGVNDGRAYKFSTFIFEPSIQAEYAFIREKSANSYLMMKGRGVNDFASGFSAYVFAGIGNAFFKPNPNDALFARMGNDYKKLGFVFPVGIAAKMSISPKVSLGAEIGGRFTTSDYIDGFTSERSKSNDIYYFGVINFIYKLKTNRNGWPTFR